MITDKDILDVPSTKPFNDKFRGKRSLCVGIDSESGNYHVLMYDDIKRGVYETPSFIPLKDMLTYKNNSATILRLTTDDKELFTSVVNALNQL